jgi:AcrR family transcriptional regulator
VSRREATKEANRATLLSAAREVFAEQGYEAAGVRDVVRRTDLAPGTFYNYFDGKDAVFRAVLEQVGAEARERVRSARLAAVTPEGFLTEGFRAFFAFIAAEPDTFAFLERNAEAVLPIALDELREDLAGRLGPGVDLDYTAHAMVAVGLRIGREMLARSPVAIDEATAFAAGLFAGGLASLPR